MKSTTFLWVGFVIIMAAIFLPLYGGVNLIDYVRAHKDFKLPFLEQTLAPLQKFPPYIAEYKYISKNYSAEMKCLTIDVNEVCLHSTNITYEDTNDGIVYLTLVRIVKGKEYVMSKGDIFFSPENLQKYNIERVRDQNFSWFPTRDVDFIITHEGAGGLGNSGYTTRRYNAKATGNNLVTSYFIERYPVDRILRTITQ